MSLIENISSIYKRISHAAMRSGRNPEEVTLVAVTKTVDTKRIIEAVNAGLRVFGENRVQEAQRKIHELRSLIPESKIEWHLIGHLQKNKARYAVQLFDLIHSVDSISLAEELDKRAKKINKIQRILIQVKLSEEETKHGVPEEDLIPLVEGIRDLKNLKLEGLMTLPPYFEDVEMVRPYFRRLKDIRDRLNSMLILPSPIRDLSMGMSHDFEIAIEEGSTMVRIGTAIFGERMY